MRQVTIGRPWDPPKLKIGSFTKSIREDLKEDNGDMTFSEESKRAMYDMDNVELFELQKISSITLVSFLP